MDPDFEGYPSLQLPASPLLMGFTSFTSWASGEVFVEGGEPREPLTAALQRRGARCAALSLSQKEFASGVAEKEKATRPSARECLQDMGSGENLLEYWNKIGGHLLLPKLEKARVALQKATVMAILSIFRLKSLGAGWRFTIVSLCSLGCNRKVWIILSCDPGTHFCTLSLKVNVHVL